MKGAACVVALLLALEAHAQANEIASAVPNPARPLAAASDPGLQRGQATNPAWTTALMRSEPQQAHCYRY